MRKEIMQALQQEYEQQRLKNSQEELRRRQEVITRCPEIGQYLAERQNLIFGGVRGILNGKAAADDLPARMDVMNKRIADLLRQSGFPADYLDPVYRCKQCRDTGYVGEPIREMCPCLRSAFYARLYREVGLGEKAEQSFAAFDPNVFSDQPLPGKKYSQRQLMDMLRHQCEQYAEKYPSAATMDLLLMGQSGLGKTYLMHAIAKRLLERGFNVMMISAYRFLDVARRAYFSGKQEEMDTLMDTDVLMIDDMGVEPLMENITIVQWFNLINERQLRGKGTVISTNLNVEELRRRYTERITSRLLDGKQCMLPEIDAYMRQIDEQNEFLIVLYQAMQLDEKAKPNAADRALVKQWTEEWRFAQMFVLGCAPWAAGKKSPMAYLNKMLKVFREKGITTMEAAKAERERFEQQPSQSTAPAARAPKVVGEQQYTQRTYTPTQDAMDAMMQEWEESHA